MATRLPTILPVALALAAATVCAAQAERAQKTTEHLVIEYDPARVSERAVELAVEIGELDFARVSEFLGESRVHAPVTVVLGGDARRTDGSWRVPRVDGAGNVLLYRYSEAEESYFTSLPHELVHVFRRGYHSGDGFLEEAFASYVSDQVQPVNAGFPLYGFAVDVVAGQWLARGEEIPLAVLRSRHGELSVKCMAQSYSLRLSFFRYLHDAYGKEAVMSVAYAPRLMGREPFARAFGKSFEELETDWRHDLRERYQRVANVDELAERYRTETPVAGWTICRAGVDF